MGLLGGVVGALVRAGRGNVAVVSTAAVAAVIYSIIRTLRS